MIEPLSLATTLGPATVTAMPGYAADVTLRLAHNLRVRGH